MIGVDDSQTASALASPSADPVLGASYYYADPAAIGARVRFASFSNSSTLHDTYDSILSTTNTVGFVLPGPDTQYPASSGHSAQMGLELNTSTIVLTTSVPVVALRVVPVLACSVHTATQLGAPETVLGNTEDAGDSSATLTFSATTLLIIRHTGTATIIKTLLYTAASLGVPKVFPLLSDSRTAPHITSTGATVTRIGGVYAGVVTLAHVTTALPTSSLRLSTTTVTATSIEEDYVQEAQAYEDVLLQSSGALPHLSAIERALHLQREHVSTTLQELNVEEYPSTSIDVSVATSDGSLLLNGYVEPEVFYIVQGVTYNFSAHIRVNNVETSTLSVGSGTQALQTYGYENDARGILSKISARPSLQVYDLPTAVFDGISALSLSGLLSTIATSIPALTSLATFNSGNMTLHVVFVDANGLELGAERAMFAPGDTCTVAVYGTHAVPFTLYVDDVAATSAIELPSSRYIVTTFTAPTSPGVHCVTASTTASFTMFRVCAPSIIRAPHHPRYYTSGQLEGDTRVSATVELIVEHRCIYAIPPTGTVRVTSGAVLVDVPVVNASMSSHSILSALFCRHSEVDCLPSSSAELAATNGAAYAYCSDVPWYACVDVAAGNMEVTCSHGLEYYTMWWRPSSSDNLTLLHGNGHWLAIRAGRLTWHTPTRTRETNAVVLPGVLAVGQWAHIALNASALYVNGALIPTSSTTEIAHVDETHFIVGTLPPINTLPLLTPASVTVPTRARQRAVECTLVLTSPTLILNVALSPAGGGANVVFTPWQVTLPTQIMTTNATELPAEFVSATTSPPSPTILSMDIRFTNAGSVRSLISYSAALSLPHIRYAVRNADSVIGFSRHSLEVLATNVESNIIRTEAYDHTATYLDNNGTLTAAPWLQATAPSSVYVTPPSLILLGTDRQLPYATTDPLTLVFNRPIDSFDTDNTVLFSLTGDDMSALDIVASDCTLQSSEILVSNSALSLSASVNYTVALAAGALRGAAGSVPCLAGTATFQTV